MIKKTSARLKAIAGTLAASVAGIVANPAMAFPVDGGVAMQAPNSATAEQVHFFHNMILMPVITVITLFVLALLIWVVVRYNSKSNPVPRKFSHNTLVEIIWTGGPILILLVISLFSFDLLFNEDRMPDGKQTVTMGDGQTIDFVFANDFNEPRMVDRARFVQVMLSNGAEARVLKNKDEYSLDGLGDPEIVVSLKSPPAVGERVIIRGGRSLDHKGNVILGPTVTIKAEGRQWNWGYSYPDFGDFDFTATMLAEEETTKELYRFAVDNAVVIPVGETIRLIAVASDVIHAWAMPAFAVKIDAIPGRTNETWFKADREGTFYGQCSEICGVNHSYMPIAVKVVSRTEFEAWIDSQRALAGMDPMFGETIKLANAGDIIEN